MLLSGTGGTTGIGIVEAFDLDAIGGPRLINLSTRGEVREGDGVLIAGLIIGGTGAQNVFIRARGPSLSSAIASDAVLENPQLTLHGPGFQQGNDDWVDAPNSGSVPAGMRPLSTSEARILVTLEPGAYTAIVSGVAGSSPRGIGTVEVFRVGEIPMLETLSISMTDADVSGGPQLATIEAHVSGLESDEAFVTLWVEDVARHDLDDRFIALATGRGKAGLVRLTLPVGLNEYQTNCYNDYERDHLWTCEDVGPPSLRVAGVSFGDPELNFYSREALEGLGFATEIQPRLGVPVADIRDGKFHDPERYADDFTNPLYRFRVTEDGIVGIRHEWILEEDEYGRPMRTYRNVWMDILDAAGNSVLEGSAIQFRPRVGAYLPAGDYYLDLRACCSFDGEYRLTFAGPVAEIVRDTDRDGLLDSHDSDWDNDGIANDIEQLEE